LEFGVLSGKVVVVSDSNQRSRDYELGHSEWELDRLAAQARLVDPITRDYFVRAGILPGMRILDIGSGAGDVAFLAAGIVGSSGEVIGTDLSATAISTASKRARECGLANVKFAQGNPSDLQFDEPFDAIVGRYVLMFCADPTAMLRGIVKHLRRDGGIAVFHEPDWHAARSFPTAPIFDECCSLIVQTFKKIGTHTNMGGSLYRTFLGAALPAPEMAIQTLVGGSGSPRNGAGMIADLVVTMAPVMEEVGVTTMEKLAPATLKARMLDEIAMNSSVVVGRSEVGAWSRLG
jgi:ubiquinone/menaquinone biosynthesis C-methylase UbiE